MTAEGSAVWHLLFAARLLRGRSHSGGPFVTAITAVFTIGYVAKMLGEDED